MATVLHPAPKIASNEGVRETLKAALGDMVLASKEEHGEIVLGVERERIEDALRLLRDEHEYQQLMEIAGVDFPQREERFEVVYMLLSLTKNHRILVKVRTDEAHPVPTVTTLWPNAGWLEREVFDMYGVIFDGNTDLRRILTDYGFEGHPFRKDFPLTGYTELRYSEEEKRVVYQPVELPQDFRTFDFMSPWEGADYVLPGDEKSSGVPAAPSAGAPPPVDVVKTTDTPAKTGAGKPANAKADKKVAQGDKAARDKASQGLGSPVPKTTKIKEPRAPDPTEDRPARAPRKGKSPETPAATQPQERKAPRKPRAKKSDGGAA
jgi:NADH-quinone oxidoreductase subunit C